MLEILHTDYFHFSNFVRLIYALSFLVMFVAIITQRSRTGHSDLLDSFYVLAFFGLFNFMGDFALSVYHLFNIPRAYFFVFLYLRFGFHILSVQFLLYFSFMILTTPEYRTRWFIYLSPLVIGIHYVIAASLPHIRAASGYAAWLLVLPSCILAAVAFFALSRKLNSLHLRSLAWDSRVLALAFLAYGPLKIPRVFGPIDAPIPRVPILVLRAFFVIVITIFVYRFLSIFRLEPSKTESSTPQPKTN